MSTSSISSIAGAALAVAMGMAWTTPALAQADANVPPCSATMTDNCMETGHMHGHMHGHAWHHGRHHAHHHHGHHHHKMMKSTKK